jgi:flavin reductase (DIM6/NTAB) family NADH-FMN oxidoreductase RutF
LEVPTKKYEFGNPNDVGGGNMDKEVKKIALRMIPYGLFVLTAESPSGKIAGATVNWVTQCSFEPPLVVVGVKVESTIHEVIEEANAFALNILGKDQQPVANLFAKHVERDGETIGGAPFRSGKTGSPILENTPAFLDCRLVQVVSGGDHSLFVGEVVDAGVVKTPEARPDEATLWLKDLGEKVFYGG